MQENCAFADTAQYTPFVQGHSGRQRQLVPLHSHLSRSLTENGLEILDMTQTTVLHGDRSQCKLYHAKRRPIVSSL